MLSSEQLTERRAVVEGDITRVEDALKQIEEQRVNLQANLYALQGALQQIDYFLENDEEEQEVEEDGNQIRSRWCPLPRERR